MATKKSAKVKMTEAAKKIMLAEVKRFATMVTKYIPDGKAKKEIEEKFAEVAALIEKVAE